LCGCSSEGVIKATQLQVTEITPALCDTLRAEIDTALKSVGDAHGVTLELGTISYTAAKATGRITILPVGGNPYASGFERYARGYGLLLADLGQEVKIDGQTYTILGLKPRATKRPTVLRRADGQIYDFPVERVRAALGRSPMTDAEELEASLYRAAEELGRRVQAEARQGDVGAQKTLQIWAEAAAAKAAGK
jgi:hypothetical protein